jgi:hypothetical protein
MSPAAVRKYVAAFRSLAVFTVERRIKVSTDAIGGAATNPSVRLSPPGGDGIGGLNGVALSVG